VQTLSPIFRAGFIVSASVWWTSFRKYVICDDSVQNRAANQTAPVKAPQL